MTARRRLACFTALLVIVLAAIAPTVRAQEGPRELTMVLTRDPVTFDPHGPLDPSGPVILSYVYDTLLYQNQQEEIVPLLAREWQVSDDGHVITFTLRDDVVFSNGAPVNADAVIFTFERLQQSSARSLISTEIANIASFEKVDDLTVRFILTEPSVTLLSALTYAYAAILEPGAVEAAGDNYGTQPVGSGPFILSEWVQGTGLTLVQNPLYNGHRPIDSEGGPVDLDTVHIRFTADQTTRVNGLLSGEVDIAYITTVPLLAPLKDDPNFSVLDDPSRGFIFLGFNMARAPFDDLALRQAVAHAINKQEIVDLARDGLGVVTNTPIPPSIFGYNPELESETPVFDLEAARRLVAAAGYGPEKPLEITLLTSTFPTYEAMATVVQAQLAAVGITVNIEVLDYGGMVAAAGEGNFDLMLTRLDWNDPDLLRVYFAADASANRYGYANPEFDALTNEGRRTFDPEARFAIYTEAQRIMLQDLPIIPLHMPITNVVVNNRIEGVELVHSHISLENARIVR
ncbi:MAG: ABC transporter substrate-binding protein [Anaerolineae bacterium]|nr:ABC transporter substrate-binding protein [Anaerolineae bacterium]